MTDPIPKNSADNWLGWQLALGSSLTWRQSRSGIRELFDDYASSHPAWIACFDDFQTLTYEELRALIDGYASELLALGLQTGDRLGICLAPSCKTLAVIYAAASLGIAILPLDPHYPRERLQRSAAAVRPRFIVGEAGADTLSALFPENWVQLESLSVRSQTTPTYSYIPPDTTLFIASTSGSTGTPKSISLSHGLVLNRLHWMWRDFPFSASDRGCWRTSMNFVDSLWEWFGYVLAGQPCYVMPNDHLSNPQQMLEKLAAHNITHIWLVPSLLDFLLDEFPDIGQRVPSLKTWAPGGEPLPQRLVHRFFAAIPDGCLLNLYGLSEAWDVLFHNIRPDERVALGKPLPNARALVVDQSLAAVPPETEGELLVAIPHMAEHYLIAPENDQDRFVSLMIDETPTVFYRTGDLAQLTRSGVFISRGRADRQLNRSGYRIEAEEIETLACLVEGVKQAALVANSKPHGELLFLLALVAYPDSQVSKNTVFDALAQQLPAAALPDLIVFLPSLPKTPSGKIDRLALSSNLTVHANALSMPPRRTTLAWLIDEIRVVLGHPVDPNHSIFHAGTHSLAAMRLILRINRQFGTTLALRDLYRCQSPSVISELIDQNTSAADARPHPGQHSPASPLQQELWSYSRLHPDDTSYHLVECWPLPCSIEPEYALRMLALECSSHPMLSACFATDSEELQIRTQHRSDDHSSIVLLDDLATARSWARQAFDLSRGPLWRCAHIMGSRGPNILFVVHHIVCDAVSLHHLRAGWEQRLAGQQPLRPTLTLAEAVSAQVSPCLLTSEERERSMRFWKTELESFSSRFVFLGDALPASADKSGCAIATSRKGLAGKLMSLPYSPVSMVLAACALTLSRVANRPDVTIAMPLNTRAHPASEELVGLCVDSVPLLFQLADMPGNAGDFVASVARKLSQAIAHQGITYGTIARLAKEHEAPDSNFPLTSVYLNYLGEWGSTSPVPLSLERELWIDLKFDLDIYVWVDGDDLTIDWHYRAQRYLPETIRFLAETVFALIDNLQAYPERDLGDWRLDSLCFNHFPALNDPEALKAPPPSLEHLAYSALTTAPSSIAVIDSRGIHSRGEILQRALALCARIPPADGDAVAGIICSDSSSVMVGILAAFWSGYAYVPLDPKYPERWLEAILANTKPSMLICSPEHVEQCRSLSTDAVVTVIPPKPSDALTPSLPTNHTATHLYTLFTSGSTGSPKAISQIATKFIVHIKRFINLLDLTPTDRIAQLASHATEAGNKDLWAALLSGGTLVQIDLRQGVPIHQLPEILASHKVTIWHSIPRIYRMLLSAVSDAIPSLRSTVLGGEQCDAETLRHHQCSPIANADLITFYGMTESSTIAALEISEHQPHFRIPLGRHWSSDSLTVRRDDDVLADVFEIGDITFDSPLLGSPGTHCKEPPTTRLKTGDLGYRHPSGDIYWISRTQWREKINGTLVDLRGIEQLLETHTAIHEAAACAVSSSAGDPQLIAWIVCDSYDELSLRNWLAVRLPISSLPSRIFATDHLPRTPNGKIDRIALSQKALPTVTSLLGHTEGSRWEAILLELWCEILGCEVFVVDEPFWTQGGNSLSIIQLVSRLAATHGLEVALDVPYQMPSVREFAEYLDRLTISSTPEFVQIPRLPEPESFPLTPLQSYYWALSQLQGGTSAYNLPVALRITPSLDTAVVEEVLNRLVLRHQALRIHFRNVLPLPQQIIHPHCRLHLEALDFSALSKDEVQLRLGELARREIALDSPPLMHAFLIDAGVQGQVLMLVLHHIIADGWSIDLLIRDFWELYDATGKDASVTSLENFLQFHDATAWIEAERTRPEYAKHRDYWMGQLSGLHAYSVLPSASLHTFTDNDFLGDAFVFKLPTALTMACREVVTIRGLSLYGLLIAPLFILFSAYTGKMDQAFCTPVANRPHPDLEKVFGLFVNLIVLRYRITPEQSLEELVRAIHDISLTGLKHGSVPLEEVLQTLAVPRTGIKNPLYQVVFRYHNQTSPQLQSDLRHVEWIPVTTGTAKVDLNLSMYENNKQGIEALLEYDSSMYDKSAIRDFVDNYKLVLEFLVTQPDLPVSKLIDSIRSQYNLAVAESGQAATRPSLRRYNLEELRGRRLAGRRIRTDRSDQEKN